MRWRLREDITDDPAPLVCGSAPVDSFAGDAFDADGFNLVSVSAPWREALAADDPGPQP